MKEVIVASQALVDYHLILKKEELEKIIPNNNYNPNESYKKAVNSLKRKIK